LFQQQTGVNTLEEFCKPNFERHILDINPIIGMILPRLIMFALYFIVSKAHGLMDIPKTQGPNGKLSHPMPLIFGMPLPYVKKTLANLHK
jgi:hypothetical protein